MDVKVLYHTFEDCNIKMSNACKLLIVLGSHGTGKATTIGNLVYRVWHRVRPNFNLLRRLSAGVSFCKLWGESRKSSRNRNSITGTIVSHVSLGVLSTASQFCQTQSNSCATTNTPRFSTRSRRAMKNLTSIHPVTRSP
jgi:hypothetical protein